LGGRAPSDRVRMLCPDSRAKQRHQLTTMDQGLLLVLCGLSELCATRDSLLTIDTTTGLLPSAPAVSDGLHCEGSGTLHCMPRESLDVDPRTLHLPPSRASGADPGKLQRQRSTRLGRRTVVNESSTTGLHAGAPGQAS